MELHSSLIVIIIIAVLIGYVNHRFVKLPSTIAMMAAALIISVALLIINLVGFDIVHPALVDFVKSLYFRSLMLDFMLGLLLFAGSLAIDIKHMKGNKPEIILLATISTIVSTFVVGTLVYWLLNAISLNINYIYCLIFGALISPTDPIAVLAIFRKIGAPKDLETIVSVESLLNDGVGVVLFLTLFNIAFNNGSPTVGHIILLFVRESIGGLLFGFVLGYCLHRLIKPINDFKMIMMLTLAFVIGGYSVANYLGLSGLLAMVAMGIFVGNFRPEELMAPETRKTLNTFWEVIDELLNSILFLLLGFEILIIQFTWLEVLAAIAAIPIVLFARYITVSVPWSLLSLRREKKIMHGVRIMVWGGLRGGLAVALALSIPRGHTHDIILCMTYGVVLFSILVQGLTMKSLVRKITGNTGANNDNSS